MTHRPPDVLERLRSTDPACVPGPAGEDDLEVVLAKAHAHPMPRRWAPVLRVAAAGALAAGALVAAIVLVPGTGDDPTPTTPAAAPAPAPSIGPTAPDTPAGRRTAVAYFANLFGQTPDEKPRPATARVVFSRPTADGEYTIWRARTEGARGSATLYSSPRTGMSSVNGVERRYPPPPYVFHVAGAAIPGANVREVYGRVSPGVARVRVLLKDGSLRDAWVDRGWWVFSQDFGHPKPIAFEGLDAAGRVLVTNRKPIF